MGTIELAIRIIIIEDEPLIASDIEFAVIEAGSEVVGFARTLDDGLELLKTTTFDGAVLDANLKGKSAKPILEQLTASNVPCIVVSGYTRDQLEFLNDATPLVGKPFSTNELVSNIRKHLVDENR